MSYRTQDSDAIDPDFTRFWYFGWLESGDGLLGCWGNRVRKFSTFNAQPDNLVFCQVKVGVGFNFAQMISFEIDLGDLEASAKVKGHG